MINLYVPNLTCNLLFFKLNQILLLLYKKISECTMTIWHERNAKRTLYSSLLLIQKLTVLTNLNDYRIFF